MSLNTISNFIRQPDINGLRNQPGMPKNLTLQDERKLTHDLKKSNRSTEKAQKAGLTHASRQTQYATM